MNYHWSFRDNILLLAIEARFSLLDFIFLFVCLLLGLTTLGFFLAFAIAYIAKIFSRKEFEFDFNQSKITQYAVILGSIRIKLKSFKFSEIEQIIYSNYDLGNPYWPVHWVKSSTYSLMGEVENSRFLFAKVDDTDREVINKLYEDMDERLSSYFSFNSELLDES